MRQLDFYFDYLSPWAYFAWLELQKWRDQRDFQVSYRPVPYPHLSKLWKQRAVATLPPKRLFIFKFALRYARSRDIPYQAPRTHPFKPYLALRLSQQDLVGNRQREMIDLLFRACWQQRVAMDVPKEVAALLSAHGFDGAALVQAAETAPVKEALVSQTSEAVARGVFGVPTMIVDGELFWGVDQFPYIEDFLQGNDPVPDGYTLPASSWGLVHLAE